MRVVTALEHRYPEFDGLNLTWESLEGIVKHNGPLTERSGAAVGRYREHGIPVGDFRLQQQIYDLELWSFASLEAQVAAIADDIAYDAHDIDDGLRAGLFARRRSQGDAAARRRSSPSIGRHYPDLDDIRRGAELVRELISYLIGAVIAEARQAAGGGPAAIGRTMSAIHGSALIAFPPAVAAGGGRDQDVPEAADVPPSAGDAGDGRGRTDPVRPVRALPAGRRAICRPNGVARTASARPKPSVPGGSAISSPG